MMQFCPVLQLYTCLQLEDLEVAQTSAQHSMEAAELETTAVKTSMQDLQVENQHCLDVHGVTKGREVLPVTAWPLLGHMFWL